MSSAEHPTSGFSKPRSVALGIAVALLVVMVTVTLAVVVVVVFGVSPARAEAPSLVASEASDDGVFVASSRRDVDEARLVAAVADADRLGLDLLVVVPQDPQPSASAFARRVQELTEVDAALVFPVDGQLEAYVVEDLSASRPRALAAARDLVDPAQAIGTFSQELIADGEEGRPAIIGQILRVLLLCSVVVGAVVMVEFLIDRAQKPNPVASPDSSS